jgi:hypothetical protein
LVGDDAKGRTCHHSQEIGTTHTQHCTFSIRVRVRVRVGTHLPRSACFQRDPLNWGDEGGPKTAVERGRERMRETGERVRESQGEDSHR